jgi:hypothetical protein
MCVDTLHKGNNNDDDDDDDNNNNNNNNNNNKHPTHNKMKEDPVEWPYFA